MLVLTGYGLGLFLAAQVGPVTLLIVRSVLRGGRAVAVGLAMAAAVGAIDLLYAAVGLAGIGALLISESMRLWLGLVSAAVLIAIGGSRPRSRSSASESGLACSVSSISPAEPA